MLPGVQLSAFLDDVCMLYQPDSVGPYKLLEEALLRNAGIQLHQGKTIPSMCGILMASLLGTPIGSGHFIRRLPAIHQVNP